MSAAVLAMPRPSTAWTGAAALWITVAGWAAACRTRFGQAWVVTPDGVASPEQALSYTEPRAASLPRRSRTLGRLLPPMAITAVKDLALYRRNRAQPDFSDGPWLGADVRLVWRQHDLFAAAGAGFSRRHDIPLVHYVHAPQVWEADRWGVRRPGWGRLIEQACERPQLLEADLVACVSDEVATEIRRFGVPSRRILVSPMSVDASRFFPTVSGAEMRRRYGLDGRFVIGWTGSFRQFHGLDLAVKAFSDARRYAPDAVLLLVGDGQERGAVERQVADLGLADSVVFTGNVSHMEIASHVAAMDAAFVVAREAESFHYSPLKLREYIMCGKPAILPYAGEMARRFHDGEDCLMYTPGSVAELGAAMRRLLDDRPAGARLAVAAMKVIEGDTWDVRLTEALRALGLEG